MVPLWFIGKMSMTEQDEECGWIALCSEKEKVYFWCTFGVHTLYFRCIFSVLMVTLWFIGKMNMTEQDEDCGWNAF